MEDIKIKIINTDNPIYQKELQLRDEVLRKPIGLNIENEDLSDEPNQIHFVALIDSELVGVVLLKLESKAGKLRQMAVKPEIQGKRLGTRLVEALELHAKSQGLKEISLHARHYAAGFYEKIGYTITSKPAFVEVGINHFEMKKEIN